MHHAHATSLLRSHAEIERDASWCARPVGGLERGGHEPHRPARADRDPAAIAQYRDLAAFAQFASDLDETTRKQLERGRMVTELMKQPQYEPLQVWEMSMTLFAVNGGFFDDIDVKKALAAEKSMRDYIKSKYADLVKRIEDTKDLSKDDEAKLNEAVKDWKANGSF